MVDSRRDSLIEALNVPRAELENRTLTLFEREAGLAYPAPLVLCGVGRLGQITLRGLRRAGRLPIALADNSPAAVGKTIEGLPVLSVQAAVERFKRQAVFVPTIYTARPLRNQLHSLGVRTASTRSVFFQHPAEYLPHGSIQWPPEMLAQADQIVEGFDVWEDAESQNEYCAQIEWQLLVRNDMPDWLPPEQTYFPNGLIRLGTNESIIDCGAFDGDTLRAVLSRTNGQFRSILALEPDPINFAALTRFVATLPMDIRSRIRVEQLAVHSHRATVKFESGDGAGSNLSPGGDIEVQAAPIDDFAAAQAPTFLKMDIEGAEPDALRGARTTMSRYAPTLAICLYHRREHLWQVPKIILEANPAYRLTLRRHSDESWETICYGRAH
jgi:FkbM family methyltransferase